MAHREFQDQVIGVGKCATWGTEPDLSSVGKRIALTSLVPTAQISKHYATDAGVSAHRQRFVKDLTHDVSFTGGGEYSFGNQEILFAAMMGSSSAAAETTSGQSDCVHTMSTTVTTPGQALTFAYTTEHDQSAVLRSSLLTQLVLNLVPAQVPTFTFSGVADRLLYKTVDTGLTNTPTIISALALPNTYENAVFAGANAYFRMNSQSGGSLSSSNDIPIVGAQLTINRALRVDRTLRGANTQYIAEPILQGLDSSFTAQLSFTLARIDDSVLDEMALFLSSTEQKAEIFFDGSAIGTGINRSLKIQMPRLRAAAGGPSGHDVQKAQKQGTFVMDCLVASSAPTGMSGVTDLKILAVSPRSTGYLG